MTITYTHEVANARLGGFSRLLVRWKGSVYKIFYKEFFIYITLYAAVSVIYRFALSESSRSYFEKLCLQFEHYTDLVPISFVLGFYVSIVIGRWWSQFENLPWPDRLMMLIGSNVHGSDDRGRLIRRTLVRYLNLAQVLTYRCVSTAVYKRFPTMRHVVDAGIMTENEYQQYENVKSENLKYWVPVLWFNNLVSKVRQEGRIYDDMMYNLIIKEANIFRGCCGQLINYDWISIPLVYTQVVTVAVYMFFLSTLLSRQYLDTGKDYSGHGVDLFIPIFTIGQFFFYVGWLKVAEQLINPFGEDDDDFEVNWVIDRNLDVSMVAVDQMYQVHPKLEKDKFWNDFNPTLPYTVASASHKIVPFMGSTYDMSVKEEMMTTRPETPASQQPCDENKTTGITLVHKSGDKTPHLLTQYLSGTLTKATPMSQRRKPRKHKKQVREFESLLTSSIKSKLDVLSELVTSDDGNDTNDDGDDEDEDHMRKTEEQMMRKKNTARLESDLNNNLKDITINEDERHVAKTKAKMSGILEDVRLDEVVKLQTLSKEEAQKLVPQAPRECSNKLPFTKDVETNQSARRKLRSLRLNLAAFPFQNVLTSSSASQNQPYNSEERKNAEKRVTLQGRRRKNRQATQTRKRTRRSESSHSLWLRRQPNLYGETYADSPGVVSVFSESDIGSGPAFDSPFSSVMSCSTSIPSPKQLRWACQPRNFYNVYGDNTSVASSIWSPTGIEDVGAEPASTFQPSFTCLPAEDSARLDELESHKRLRLNVERSCSYSSSGRDESVTPFADELRKRLQVVPATSSTAPTSPTAEKRFFFPKTRTEFSENKEQFFDSSSKADESVSFLPNSKLMKEHADSFRKGNNSLESMVKNEKYHEEEGERNPKISHNVFNNFKERMALSRAESPRNDELSLFSANSSISSGNTNGNKRNGTSIWNALKTWNSKRKEIKTKKRDETISKPRLHFNVLPTIPSAGNFQETGNLDKFKSLNENSSNSQTTSDQHSTTIVLRHLENNEFDKTERKEYSLAQNTLSDERNVGESNDPAVVRWENELFVKSTTPSTHARPALFHTSPAINTDTHHPEPGDNCKSFSDFEGKVLPQLKPPNNNSAGTASDTLQVPKSLLHFTSALESEQCGTNWTGKDLVGLHQSDIRPNADIISSKQKMSHDTRLEADNGCSPYEVSGFETEDTQSDNKKTLLQEPLTGIEGMELDKSIEIMIEMEES